MLPVEMHLTRSRQQGWAWLLAVLLLGSASAGLGIRPQPGGAPCSSAPHACCCARPGRAHCCCHAPAGGPLAALSACGGSRDLPALLAVLPPAIPPPERIGLAPPYLAGRVAIPAPASLRSHSSPPPTPPPQAA